MREFNFKISAKDLLAITFFMQFFVIISVFLDIPVLRQVIVFSYFTFFPGLLILKISKLQLEKIELLLLSVGLSLAFLMFATLIVNELCIAFGMLNPLSLFNLLIPLSTIALSLALLNYFRNKTEQSVNTIKLEKLWIPLPFLLLLSIIGAINALTFKNNLLLLVMFVVIAFLLIFIVLSKKSFSYGTLAVVLFFITIAVLYQSALVSDNMLHFGSDVPGEIFAAKIVQTNGYWSSLNPFPTDLTVGRTYDMLSVTLLPVLFSNLLGMDVALVFKLIFPLIFALIPLGLYCLWSKSIEHKYAFLAAFLFVAYQPFYNELLGLNKQLVGSFFLVLILIVLFSKNVRPIHRSILLFLFSFCLVVSHYGLAEVFLIFLSVALVYSLVRRRPFGGITPTLVLSIFVMLFAWYVFTSGGSVYESMLSFGQNLVSQIGDLFNFQSREQDVLRGLGLATAPTVWNLISRVFAYVTEIFIVLGFIAILLKRQTYVLYREQMLFMFVAMIFLASLVIIPGLSSTMGMTRFYEILLIFIAPLFVIGVLFVSNLVFKKRKSLYTAMLFLIILAPYFLFQTGVVYETTQSTSWSVSLSGYRMSVTRLYQEFGVKNDSTINAAQWIAQFVNSQKNQVYADAYSANDELNAYSMIYKGRVEILSNTTILLNGAVVYLNPCNTIDNTIVGLYYDWNTTDLHYLSDLSNVYSNGANIIYKK